LLKSKKKVKKVLVIKTLYLYLCVIINQQKQNAMNKEEILQVILDYTRELKSDYEENRDAFGELDEDTQRSVLKLFVVEELLTRLGY